MEGRYVCSMCVIHADVFFFQVQVHWYRIARLVQGRGGVLVRLLPGRKLVRGFFLVVQSLRKQDALKIQGPHLVDHRDG